jgi:NADPH:quinone reductase-like Zn-dependent oxidoreductase
MLVYGLLSGQPIPLNAGEMLFKGSSIHGYWLAYWLRAKPREHIAGVMMKLMSLMAEGKLIPPVEAEYDLADFRQALQHAQTPGRSGKVLFTG